MIGLVQLLSDDEPSSEPSAAAAVDGVTEGGRELAVAMYTRAEPVARVRGYETAN